MRAVEERAVVQVMTHQAPEVLLSIRGGLLAIDLEPHCRRLARFYSLDDALDAANERKPGTNIRVPVEPNVNAIIDLNIQ